MALPSRCRRWRRRQARPHCADPVSARSYALARTEALAAAGRTFASSVDALRETVVAGAAAVARLEPASEPDNWLEVAGSARGAARARAVSLLAADRRESRREGGVGREAAEALREAQREGALSALRAARDDAASLLNSTKWAPAAEGAYRDAARAALEALAAEAAAEAAALQKPLTRTTVAPLGSLGALGALGFEFGGRVAAEEADMEEVTTAEVRQLPSLPARAPLSFSAGYGCGGGCHPQQRACGHGSERGGRPGRCGLRRRTGGANGGLARPGLAGVMQLSAITVQDPAGDTAAASSLCCNHPLTAEN